MTSPFLTLVKCPRADPLTRGAPKSADPPASTAAATVVTATTSATAVAQKPPEQTTAPPTDDLFASFEDSTSAQNKSTSVSVSDLVKKISLLVHGGPKGGLL